VDSGLKPEPAGEDARIAELQAEVERLRRQLEQSQPGTDASAGETKFHAIADSIDQMIWSTTPDGLHDYFNRRWYEYTGVPHGSTDGEGWNAAFHPDDQERAWKTWRRSLETGERYEIEYRLRHRSGEYRWVLGRAQPVRDESGAIARWYGTCTDIHDLKVAEAARREGASQMRTVADSLPVLISYVDRDHCYRFNNKAYEDVFGLTVDELRGKHVREVIGAAGFAALEPVVSRVFAGERQRAELLLPLPDGARHVAIDYVPDQRGDTVAGYFALAQDISEQKESEARLRESEARFRAMADSAPSPAWVTNEQGIEFVNQALCEFAGLPAEEITGSAWTNLIHPDDLPEVARRRAEAWETGAPYIFEARFRRVDGAWRWLMVSSRPRADLGGGGRGYVGMAVDVTEKREASDALREQGRTLATINRIGAAIAAELDLQRLVQMVTDAGVELTGAQFGAFFYNVLNQAGESYMLYTLSGARRDQFELGMPRATAVFHPTFTGEGVIRSDDITSDPRYGLSAPHFGMPEGHLPVLSYLAVPVVSRSGEVIGGLFFGHPERARFSDRHEELMTGIAAQAAIAMDNARLYESAQKELASRMRAEQELRLLNETLEQRVAGEVERRAEAEEALHQAQKMETLGQLTGGVAHDFNNLLQIVSGNIDLILRNLAPDDAKLRRAADNAARGAERAAVLTQRLLAFSRRQPLAPKPIDPNRLVSGMSELLHRTLGETIEVETVLASGLWPVEVDPNQLENALLNLAVNARDAMQEGGKLTIETCNTHLDRSYAAQNAGVVPGQYVAICVTDTGGGMSEEVVGRAFEPFFTTKEVGKGTGLGLSMVYGFVKQSGGHLKIYSEPGEGTCVKIYLPRMLGEKAQAEEEVEVPAPEGGRDETILVCEDDDDVRAFTVEVLRELGYHVIEAPDGPSALRLLERQEGRVDLLFTDVVLPGGMTGSVLAGAAREKRPGLKVLFTTGYARNAIVHHGRLDAGVALITKPFTYSDLAARVREMLDGVP
jgi:PAS domain S-box-containing protein